MKEATGELNMTVVTVVAIAAVGGFFYAFVWPSIRAGLMKNTCSNVCPVGDDQSRSVSVAKGENDTYTCTCPDGSTLTVDKNGNLVSTEKK